MVQVHVLGFADHAEGLVAARIDAHGLQFFGGVPGAVLVAESITGGTYGRSRTSN